MLTSASHTFLPTNVLTSASHTSCQQMCSQVPRCVHKWDIISYEKWSHATQMTSEDDSNSDDLLHTIFSRGVDQRKTWIEWVGNSHTTKKTPVLTQPLVNNEILLEINNVPTNQQMLIHTSSNNQLDVSFYWKPINYSHLHCCRAMLEQRKAWINDRQL